MRSRGFVPLLLLIPLVLFLLAGGVTLWFLSRSGDGAKEKDAGRRIADTTVPSIRIVPDKTVYASGETATFSVFIDTKGQEIIGTDLELLFDPSTITIEERGIATSDIFPKFIGGNTGRKFVDPPNGIISISGIIGVAERQAKVVTPDEPVVIIQGTVKDSGEITVVFEPGETDDSNLTKAGAGIDILEAVEDGEFVVR